MSSPRRFAASALGTLNPGASFRGIHDSFVNYLGNTKPEMIVCNHEEISVTIAQGYGHAAGKPMAAFVHDIVGLLHTANVQH